MSEGNEQQPAEETAPERGYQTLVSHIKANPLDFGLWVTRLATILFSVGYVLPLFGDPSTYYYKALMANAATSALRLQQRMPTFQFSREFLTLVLTEDSAHYLLYSLIFLYATPLTLALIPVFLFAVLHFSSTSLTLLDKLGQNSWWGARFLIGIVEVQSVNMLKMIAYCEIFLMPLNVMMIFAGKSSLFTVFLYYRFLTLRYASRRNPYTRNSFSEFRITAEYLASKPQCPAFARNLIFKAIGYVTRMAPPTVTVPAQ